MTFRSILSARNILSAAAIAVTFAACAPTTPPGATTSATYGNSATAQVTAVDKARRELVLQSSDGRVARVEVPPDVRNFNQIKVGDTVRISYRTRVDIAVAGNQPPVTGVTVEAGGARAPAGQKPAGLWATRTQRAVQIVSVDRNSHTVTFREPDGSLDSIVVQDPANYALADGLRPGTYVVVTETSAVAASVDKI
jgi:hypothetical protein